MTWRRAPLIVFLLLALVAIAEARPGGGGGFSGGGGHGGGSSGGGGGDAAAVFELIYHLVRLCIYYPYIGFPLVAILLALWIRSAYIKHRDKDWDSGPPIELKRPVPLDPIRTIDPDFSPVLFEDFCFRLYATCMEVRHDDARLAGLAPYVSDNARKQLATREPRGPTTAVIVGAMRPWFVDPPRGPDGSITVGLELETNYTVMQGEQRTTYAIERWTLARAGHVRSRKPDPARRFPCPNCGAPWEASRAHDVQKCSSCDQIVDNGRFDWLVTSIQLVHSKLQPPTLTEEVMERGTDLATYRAHDADHRWSELVTSDPALTQQALLARVGVIYKELYAAWANNDLGPARSFLSDGLADYLTYWIEAYKQQGLRNQLVDMRITNTELAKVTRDRWFDAVTLRIWGTGKDFVVRKRDGHVVRGSRGKERPYSEYWTLIRSSARKGAPRADRNCGNCGAPADVGMAGACTHCGAHLTSGDFDWVLSKIEQDDTYRG